MLTRWNSFDDVFNFSAMWIDFSTSSGVICRPALLPPARRHRFT